MSHDGGPSPMYWVIWSVFQNLQSFPVFPGTTWSSCTACAARIVVLASRGLGMVSLLVICMVIQC